MEFHFAIIYVNHKWLKIYNNGTTNNGQNSPHIVGLICFIEIHLNIFDKYIPLPKYLFLSLIRIYLDIYLQSFNPEEYIQIFVCTISVVTNIFWYSFVQNNDILHTLYIAQYLLYDADWAICTLTPYIANRTLNDEQKRHRKFILTDWEPAYILFVVPFFRKVQVALY